jgi:signal transduction histidine kinase
MSFETEHSPLSERDALEAVVRGMAHDYRNRLQVVHSALSVIKAKAVQGADLSGLVDAAQTSLFKARDLASSIATVGCRLYGQREDVDLNDVLDDMRPVLASLCGVSVGLSLHKAMRPVRVRCNAHLLENAIINLVLNACEAVAGRGAVSIEVARLKILGDGAEARERSCAMITVSDSGPGLSDEARRFAFSPYFTTKPAAKGSGLGLMMTRLFAEGAGGSVEMQSIAGGGTSVSLLLPEAPSPLSSTRSNDHD